MSLLAFERVGCRRGGRILFDDLSLALGPGEAIRVTGANGVGKSSLLRLAAGLLAPFRGRVVRGVQAALADDAVALDRERTLGDALGWWAALDGVAADLDSFGLADLASAPVRFLSTGQLRRARLARVAASGAPLWLLDEPLNGLDGASVRALAEAIEAHRAAGGAVLAASHASLAGAWREIALR